MNMENQDNVNLSTQISAEIQETIDAAADLELEKYVLRLYVANSSLKSMRAVQQIQKICQEYLAGRYELEIIDIYKHPERLEDDQIFATPTLIKELPPPLQRLIGDMTDVEKVIICLNL